MNCTNFFRQQEHHAEKMQIHLHQCPFSELFLSCQNCVRFLEIIFFSEKMHAHTNAHTRVLPRMFTSLGDRFSKYARSLALFSIAQLRTQLGAPPTNIEMLQRQFPIKTAEESKDWKVDTGTTQKQKTLMILVGSILAVYIVQLMPQTSNSLIGVLTTALFGTLLMVPTWTEIPLAAGLVNNGLTGIAAAALITLPAVSIPCLSVLAGALNNIKVTLILGLSVLVAGVIAGIIFL